MNAHLGPFLALLPLLGSLCGCAVTGRLIGRPCGPYDGQVLDAETGDPVVGALVFCLWYPRTLASGRAQPGEVVEGKYAEAATDHEGRYSLARRWVRSGDRLHERLFVYRAGYACYSSVAVFPTTPGGKLRAQGEFRRRGNLAKLHRWTDGLSHLDHLAFIPIQSARFKREAADELLAAEVERRERAASHEFRLEKLKALQALIEKRGADQIEPALRTTLAEEDWVLRHFAAEELATRGDNAAIGGLIADLCSTDTTCARDALRTLRKVTARPEGGETTLASPKHQIAVAEHWERWWTKEGNCRLTQERRLLEVALLSEHPPNRRAAIEALAFSHYQALDANLERFVRDHDPEIRRLAVESLMVGTDETAVIRKLLPLLAETDLYVRQAAAAALARLKVVDGIDELITDLAEMPRSLQSRSVSLLRALSGRHFQYTLDGDRRERNEAIGRWEDWWATNRDHFDFPSSRTPE